MKSGHIRLKYSISPIFSLLSLTFPLFSAQQVGNNPPVLTPDTVISHNLLSQPSLYISSGLITTGIYLNAAGNGKMKVNFQDYVQELFPGFQTNVDDYLQWFPALEMGIADLAGYDAAHSPLHQAGLYMISVTANALIVSGLKEITGITRPNGGGHAFPSGHTSNAFVNATVLYLEFRDKNKILAWSGYIFATTTGILRIMNNAHWVSDVVAGAGIGILIPHVIYAIDPFKNFKGKQNKQQSSNFIFMPLVLPGHFSFSLSYTF
ncbi:MAG: phosphatase PAP2 family protein [Chlorobi bacterium]|nr:phosphatase PAP2 family protein [Chlorobiota bacterium]